MAAQTRATPSVVADTAPAPGKGAVPAPAVVKKVIVSTGTAGPVAVGGSHWDWIAAHPWETGAIAGGVALAIGGSVYVLTPLAPARPGSRHPPNPSRSRTRCLTGELIMLTFVLIAATLVAIYWLWVRPILKTRPGFIELYAREESILAALREKFAGIKQKLSSVAVIGASAAVSGYDFLAPIVGGVDVTSIAASVPSWAWPLILISVTAIFQFLRGLADKRHEAETAEAPVGQQEG